MPAAPQMDQADIARLLQAHLKRVGCNPGNVDGSWDNASKAALELFNRNAQTKLSVQLAVWMLSILFAARPNASVRWFARRGSAPMGTDVFNSAARAVNF